MPGLPEKRSTEFTCQWCQTHTTIVMSERWARGILFNELSNPSSLLLGNPSSSVVVVVCYKMGIIRCCSMLWSIWYYFLVARRSLFISQSVCFWSVVGCSQWNPKYFVCLNKTEIPETNLASSFIITISRSCPTKESIIICSFSLNFKRISLLIFLVVNKIRWLFILASWCCTFKMLLCT